MAKVDLDIKRDGYITASYLQGILNQMADAVEEKILALDSVVAEQRCLIQRLERELDQERRIRLSMGARLSRRIRS